MDRLMRSLGAAVLAAALTGCAMQSMQPRCVQEKFDAFLPRYMADRQFAVERTVFPLESIDASEEKKSLVTREQFAKSTLLADLIKTEKLSTKLDAKPEAVQLDVFVPDSDALVFYYRFRQQNGCWHLWQFEDASL